MEIILKNKRYRELLEFLLQSDEYVSSNELSKKLSVSDRTIKRDISTINQILNKYECEIVSKHGQGYRIKKRNRKKIASKISEYDSYSSPQDQRLYNIAIHLLSSKDTCTLYEIEDALFISRSTLENDLKRLRTLLNHTYSSIKLKRQHEMVYLSGDEFSLRLFFNKLLHSKYSYIDQSLSLEHPDLNLNVFESIKYRTISIMTKYVQLHDLAIADIAAYLFITKKRLHLKQEIQSSSQNEYIINHSEVIHTMAKELLNSIILSDVDCQHTEIELEHLIIKLSFMNIYIPQTMKKEDVYQHTPDNVIHLVEEILLEINQNYQLNLSNDDQLFCGLVYHISALLNRASYPELFKKPEFTMPIKKEYPFIFELSLRIKTQIETYTHRVIDEDDISYIAARIAASIEKHKISRKIRIALISHYGASYTELLNETLKSTFSPMIEIVGVYYVYQINNIFDHHPDIIIHTFNIDKYHISKQTKTLQTTYILTRENKIKLFDLIEECKSESVIALNQNITLNKFDKKLFFRKLNLSSKEEIISLLTNMFIINHYADQSFFEEVLKKEELSSTIINEKAAILSPLDYFPVQSKIGVLILDHPVSWNENDVEIVFILSLTKDDQKDLGAILHKIDEITSNKYTFSELLNVNDFDSFLELFINS